MKSKTARMKEEFEEGVKSYINDVKYLRRLGLEDDEILENIKTNLRVRRYCLVILSECYFKKEEARVKEALKRCGIDYKEEW